jgi:hypothetical protein
VGRVLISQEINRIPGDLDGLAAKLADRLWPYVGGAVPVPGDADLGREVKQALELSEATDDMLADLGIAIPTE